MTLKSSVGRREGTQQGHTLLAQGHLTSPHRSRPPLRPRATSKIPSLFSATGASPLVVLGKRQRAQSPTHKKACFIENNKMNR